MQETTTTNHKLQECSVGIPFTPSAIPCTGWFTAGITSQNPRRMKVLSALQPDSAVSEEIRLLPDLEAVFEAPKKQKDSCQFLRHLKKPVSCNLQPDSITAAVQYCVVPTTHMRGRKTYWCGVIYNVCYSVSYWRMTRMKHPANDTWYHHIATSAFRRC